MYAYFRFELQSGDRSLVQTRDVFIQWVGPKVGTLERGKKKADLTAIQEVFKGYHFAVTVYSRRKLTIECLMAISNNERTSVID